MWWGTHLLKPFTHIEIMCDKNLNTGCLKPLLAYPRASCHKKVMVMHPKMDPRLKVWQSPKQAIGSSEGTMERRVGVLQMCLHTCLQMWNMVCNQGLEHHRDQIRINGLTWKCHLKYTMVKGDLIANYFINTGNSHIKHTIQHPHSSMT